MSVIEFLSQPFWYRLGLTLTHFLWQGLAVFILVSIIVQVFRPRPGNARYCVFLLGFVFLTMCPVITFIVIDVPLEPVARATVIRAESRPDPGALSYNTPPSNEMPIEREVVVGETNAQGSNQRSTPLGQRVYNSLQPVLPWAMAGWMFGVVLLSGRLLLGFMGICRWRRHLKPLPEDLAQRVTLLCERLGMRRFSRVFISPSAVQAMAAGYLRPLVLLPASMVTKMQPEMLEAVIAHELGHIRRFDLWINLAQRVIEILLFYHPAVWWLSSQIRSERELCCDELAVGATGERLIYASALENASRVRFEAEEPALSLAFSHHRNSILGRVRYILGLPAVQPDSRFWLAGLITFVVLVVIAMPITSAMTAHAGDKSETKSLHKAAADGDVEQVKSLLSKGIDVNAKDENGRTPLHTATIQGRVDVILLLATHGADMNVKDRQGHTALYYAASNGSCRSGSRVSVVQHLLALGADPTIEDLSDETPLHQAARLSAPGSTSIMAGLIAYGADIDAKNREGRTAAHVKAMISSGADLERLIDLGADLNTTDKDGNSVLHLAIEHARPREKESILACDVNVNLANAEGQTPLHIASRVGNQKIVEGLITKGAVVDVKDHMGQTALHIAAVKGHTNIASMLVDQGASVNTKTKEGHTAAYLAVRSLNNMVADHLIKKGAEVSNICMASYVGDLPRVRDVIAGGVGVNTKDEQGFGPLHAAAAGGHNDVIEYLLAQGVEPKQQVRAGWTALVYAVVGNHMGTVELLRTKGVDAGMGVSKLLPNIAERGNINAAKCLIECRADVNVNNGAPLRKATRAGQKDMVELLVAEGANVNVCGTNIEGWTPLSLAVHVDRPDIAACLITAGADVDADGWTPLMEAPYTCKGTEMVELLIKARAEVNKRTDTGWTALHSAAEKREDIATLLLDAGANPNVRSNGHGGRTPLHEAAWFGPNVIKVLVDNGADINARDNQGYTPLHFAFYYGLRDSVQQLVALGADINVRTNSGETILHLAATARRDTSASTSFIDFLLANGADLNARDNFGWTPLHHAALLGELEVVRVLLTHGADTSSVTSDGKTVSDLARKNGHIGIVELLRKYRAKK